MTNEHKPVVKYYLTTEKPVAWLHRLNLFTTTDSPEFNEEYWIPLYTKPTRRLTDNEIQNIIDIWSDPKNQYNIKINPNGLGFRWGGAQAADDEYVDMKEFIQYVEDKLMEINK